MLKTHPLHEQALRLTRSYLKLESELIDCLQKIDRERVFEMLGYTSLFQYAVSLGLSEGQAYTLIGVARKCAEVPELKQAIDSGELTASKARKVVSVMTKTNSQEWIAKAIELPQQILEREVAKMNPKTLIPERVRPVCEDRSELRTGISRDLENKIGRVRELVTSKERTPCSLEHALEVMAEAYLRRNDPVRKDSTVPRLQVLKRDEGQCRHIDGSGKRCSNRIWLQVHHIKPRAEGGNDNPENLVTLCQQHHHMLHDHEARRVTF